MSTFLLIGVPGQLKKVIDYLELNGLDANILANLDTPVSSRADGTHYTPSRATRLDNLTAYTLSRGAKLDNLDNLDAPVSAIATGAMKAVTRYITSTHATLGYTDVTVPAGTNLAKSVLSFLEVHATAHGNTSLVIRTSKYLEELNATTIRVHGTNFDGTSTSGNITVRWQLAEYT